MISYPILLIKIISIKYIKNISNTEINLFYNHLMLLSTSKLSTSKL